MTQREEFEAWWEEFCSAHEDWRFADSDALRWAAWQAAQAAQPSQAREPNSGHGHVWPRPDGVKARCGGSTICQVCAIDAAINAKESK